MKARRRPILSVLSNGLFALGLYLAIAKEIPWLDVIVIGFVWLMLFCYLATLFDDEARGRLYRGRDYRVLALEVPFDAVVTVVLATAGWDFTAGAYVLSCLILFAIYFIKPKG